MNMKNKYALTVAVFSALAIGFLAGYLYSQRGYYDINRLALVTAVMRDDAVLTQIESGDIGKAKKTQTEYLKFSLLSLSVLGGGWPENINSIVLKRKDLIP